MGYDGSYPAAASFPGQPREAVPSPAQTHMGQVYSHVSDPTRRLSPNQSMVQHVALSGAARLRGRFLFKRALHGLLHADMAAWEWTYLNEHAFLRRGALVRLVFTAVEASVMLLVVVALLSAGIEGSDPGASELPDCWQADVTYVAGVAACVVLLLSAALNVARVVHTATAAKLPA